MRLSQILSGARIVNPDYMDCEIEDIENDSRKSRENTLFIAASGYVEDAHPFVLKAYENGCRHFVVEGSRLSEFEGRLEGAIVLGVEGIHHHLALLSKNFFQNPTATLKMVGITGTSGKTTTAFAVFSVLRALGRSAGLIGTIEYRINERLIPATNTTPDILTLNRLFAEMVSEGVEYLVMEVSSHSLSLGRVAELSFDIVAYTNFSQDHLDFHRTMEEYFAAKLLIFDLLHQSPKTGKKAVLNRETEGFERILEYAKQFSDIEPLILSLADSSVDYYSEIETLSPEQTQFLLNGEEVEISMIGRTNVYNFSQAAIILIGLGFEISAFKTHLRGIRVCGRMETVPNGLGVSVIVDYAHKPDALAKLIGTVRPMLSQQGRIWTVFGCGGDRDKGKRPIMGRIAAELSDFVVLTSDNPRTEDPLTIIGEIEAGVLEFVTPYTVIENRREAIHYALQNARKGDCVLIAGKGHEDYQIIGKTKHHFSDREEVEKYYSGESHG